MSRVAGSLARTSAENEARQARSKFKSRHDPAEAQIAVMRERHRFRLAAKAPRSADLQGFLRAMLAAAPEPRGGVRVAIDVDPQSFL